MNKAAVLHRAGGNLAFPLDHNTLKIRLRAARKDLKEVIIIYGSRYPIDHSDPHQIEEMKLAGSDGLHDYFEATIKISDNRFRYYFYLNDGNEGIWFTEKGFSNLRPSGVWGFGEYFQFPVVNENDIFDIPDWVQDAIFYQIFPERFYNGDSSNDPEDTAEWGEKPGRDSFFGGDLEGIIKKMDYLSGLGINAIYLTPVFTSPSNHKYNVDDYYSIDPAFGDLSIARKLVEEAHQRGIRVMFDAVFNHSGYDFFAFKDVREKGEESSYWDWFFIEDSPIKTEGELNYTTFANNIRNMPKLNTSNPEVQSYFLDVAEYWIKEIDIDGWRLDVADEVDHQFWRKFRERVRSIKNDIYIVGENWHNSEDWLEGDQFDAIMNYPLGMAVFDFFAENTIGPEDFNHRLTKNWILYQDKVNYAMLNLLDSHDTPRLLNFFSGEKKLMKLAVIFQMTYPGAPMIYYGDEVGMEGEGDPDCRRCMIWDKEVQDRSLQEFYRKLIQIRRSLISLRRGSCKPVLIDQVRNLFGYLRTYNNEKTLVVFNNSSQARELSLDTALIHSQDELGDQTVSELHDLLSDKSFVVKGNKYIIDIPEYSAVILNK